MFKVKEDFDLENLKKYGFEFNIETGKYELLEKSNGNCTHMRIKSWDRVMEFRQNCNSDYLCLKILCELFKENIIEFGGKK